MFFFYIFTILLTFLRVAFNEFKVTCPTVSQWRLREYGYCKILKHSMRYICFRDTDHNSIVESCTMQPDYAPPGQKYVWTGALRNIDCSSNRFQPFVLYQNESDHCLYLKSTCNEEGQIVYANKNLLEDLACRCDYTKGYVFVTKPEHLCYCIPTQEDCSCYKKTCSHNKVLISDYRCVLQDSNLTESQCPVFSGGGLAYSPKYNKSTKVHTNDDKELSVFSVRFSFLIIVILIFIAIIVTVFCVTMKPIMSMFIHCNTITKTQSTTTDNYNVEKIEKTQALIYNDGSTKEGSSDKIPQYLYLSSKYTSVSKWRYGILNSLKRFMFNEAEAQTFLYFIIEIFENAIKSADEYGTTREIKKPNTVPNNLLYRNWISIIQGVGLDLDFEREDLQNDIRSTAVFLPRQPNIETFRQFINVLKCIQDCNWTVLQTLINDFSEEQQLALLQMMENCIEENKLDETDRGFATALYESETFLMRQLGFFRTSPKEPLTWLMSTNAVQVASILKALFGHLTQRHYKSGQI